MKRLFPFRKDNFAKQHGHDANRPYIVCWSCPRCHFGWHVSIYDKKFSYCPNCGRKLKYK